MIKCTQTHAYGHAQIQFVRTQCNRISGELKMRLHRKHTAHTYVHRRRAYVAFACYLNPIAFALVMWSTQFIHWCVTHPTKSECVRLLWWMQNEREKKQQHELLKWNNHIDEKQSQHEIFHAMCKRDGKELECCFFDSVFSLYVNFGVSSSLSALLIAFGLCMLSPSRKVYSPMPIL